MEKKFYIVTDSSSDITQKEAKQLGITVLPISVNWGEEVYQDGINLSFSEFYKKLEATEEPAKTSQLTYEAIENAAMAHLGNKDVLFVSISSGMSATFSVIEKFKKEVEKDSKNKVYAFDSETVTLQLGKFVFEAIRLRNEGKTAKETYDELERLKPKSTLYANVEDLKYLKRGGRIKPTAAVIGTLLNIKPIITIRDKMVENIGKEFGQQKAFNKIIELGTKEEIDLSKPVYVGHSNNLELGKKLAAKLKERANIENIVIRDIGPTVGTHIGPNCVGLAFFKK
ncbi:MAG: DegV family protein [Firmicutes bacterium]|nr:DegV family protein [Bacillota bacterium]MCL2771028.1 DegV family protein [Bacillota bacterium]